MTCMSTPLTLECQPSVAPVRGSVVGRTHQRPVVQCSRSLLRTGAGCLGPIDAGTGRSRDS